MFRCDPHFAKGTCFVGKAIRLLARGIGRRRRRIRFPDTPCAPRFVQAFAAQRQRCGRSSRIRSPTTRWLAVARSRLPSPTSVLARLRILVLYATKPQCVPPGSPACSRNSPAVAAFAPMGAVWPGFVVVAIPARSGRSLEGTPIALRVTARSLSVTPSRRPSTVASLYPTDAGIRHVSGSLVEQPRLLSWHARSIRNSIGWTPWNVARILREASPVSARGGGPASHSRMFPSPCASSSGCVRSRAVQVAAVPGSARRMVRAVRSLVRRTRRVGGLAFGLG